MTKWINILLAYSAPLILGVIIALFMANSAPSLYETLIHHRFFGLPALNLQFLANEVFMVLFFGIAAKEIVEACLPNGALNPIKKAVNPLLGTLGGVIGPIAVFFLLTHLFGYTELNRGWGIPTATDIALAWLAARLVFGARHPAVNFLLLLAIVDDAIGLGIIALFYGDPLAPVQIGALIYVGLAMGIAYIMRKWDIRYWELYVAIPGVVAWYGLHEAHLHPALALVFIVPFMPTDKKDHGLFVEKERSGSLLSPLQKFEHTLKKGVEIGLFFFAFANAGVALESVSGITWIILTALVLGKAIGVTLFSGLGILCGIPLPEGMSWKHLPVVGLIAGMGLTVALFVSSAAYTGELAYAQGPAKMGALLSVVGLALAWGVSKGFKLKKRAEL